MLLEAVNRRAQESPHSDTTVTLMQKINKSHYGSLELAVEYGHEDLTKILLEYNSDRNLLQGPLILAVKYQYTEIVKLLLQYGANPNPCGRIRYSILEFAIRTKNENIVQILLDYKADVNIGIHFETPLLCAIACSTGAIVELLLQNGADPDYVTAFGVMPLTEAVREGCNKDIVEKLLSLKPDVNFENEYGETPLCMAIKDKHLEIRDLLLQNGASVNHADSSGWTLLIHAVQREDDDAVRILLNLNADVNGKGED
ncbi:hypothetical protein Trydic_g18516, partial [Trypoxylus dichotomus]